MKTISRYFGCLGLVLFSCSTGKTQDLGTRQSIEASDFYVFTEAGGQYIPSIQFNNSSVVGIPINLTSGAFSYSGNYSANITDPVMKPGIGYDFVLGFGYQINKNLGIEIEVGYGSASLGSTGFSVNSSSSGTVSAGGIPIGSAQTTGSGTGSFTGSSMSLTTIPILVGLSVQERSERFQPLASLGIGVCPSVIKADNLSLSWTDSGTITSSGGSSSYSGAYFSGSPGSITTQTAYPFAFKGKVGFDYAFSSIGSIGVRAWAMGLVNSNFGSDLQADLYGAIGLNAVLKFRF